MVRFARASGGLAPGPLRYHSGIVERSWSCNDVVPDAASGWLCIYENREQNQRAGAYPSVVAPGSGFSPSASRYGASLLVQGQAAGTDWFFWSEGTWVVTAP